MRAVLLFSAVVLLPATALGDQVVLKEGQIIEGRVLSESPTVVVQVDGGKVSFDRADVIEVKKSDSDPLAILATKRSALSPTDVKGRLELARFAVKSGFSAEARALFREVLEIDPKQAEAHAGLGHVKHEGKWLTEDEHHLALGHVRWSGRWVTQEEAELLLAEESARREERARREATKKPEQLASAPKEQEVRASSAAWGNDLWVGGAPPLQNSWGYSSFTPGFWDLQRRGHRNGGFGVQGSFAGQLGGAGVRIELNPTVTRGPINATPSAPAPTNHTRGRVAGSRN